MNNSIVELKDFELDEISGGGVLSLAGFISTTQTEKKLCAGVIKRICGIATSAILYFPLTIALEILDSNKPFNTTIKDIGNELKNHSIVGMSNKKFGLDLVYAAIPAFTVGNIIGEKFGKYICQKIGLED